MKDSKTLNLALAKTGAERQREYRERQKLKQGKRLDLYIPLKVHEQLECLAEQKGSSIKDLVISLVENEYRDSLGQKIARKSLELNGEVEQMVADPQGVFQEKPKQSDFFENLSSEGFEDLNLRD
ncbi:hypothetical protein [Acinetobacter indicus]|uniref:hypothetical protein n=1 Tax=Acinetobacter indicus TaxID=756892 RepID=UPI00144013F7|nr:hypothetical protein [Acinetobacter indicus]MDM1292578.1 hypothetical protein [Acinetobacter indicus]MDM1322592.1 hypothetical protein [Acinetobacter indicus]MDM1334330.1 hypothetical protein [Acinetobacter indicus]QIZ60492.1 hypothetical protein FK537_15355 [Acinetobacter indicus]